MVTIDIIKRHFLPSLHMLEVVIETSSEDMWNKTENHAPLWQHVMHTLESIDYCFTDEQLAYLAEEYKQHIPYDFSETQLEAISQTKCREYFQKVKDKSAQFFIKYKEELFNECYRLKNLTVLDVLLVQIRHIQYHSAYCSSIFSRNGLEDITWLGYCE